MKPMEPMAPMKAMEPMPEAAAWWPADLGRPGSSGAQNGRRYAFFPENRRLAVEQDGAVTLYDSGDHRISGVSQDVSGDGSLTFSTEGGTVRIEDLRRIG
jgi:hypothetical protein